MIRGRACACSNDGFYGDWVQLDGTAEILSLPDAMEPLVEYYRSLSGEHPDWDDYRAAMERDQRLLIRIRVERAGPNVAGSAPLEMPLARRSRAMLDGSNTPPPCPLDDGNAPPSVVPPPHRSRPRPTFLQDLRAVPRVPRPKPRQERHGNTATLTRSTS